MEINLSPGLEDTTVYGLSFHGYRTPSRLELTHNSYIFDLRPVSLFLLLETDDDWQDELLSDIVGALESRFAAPPPLPQQ